MKKLRIIIIPIINMAIFWVNFSFEFGLPKFIEPRIKEVKADGTENVENSFLFNFRTFFLFSFSIGP